jgi:hypothetical protein
MSVSTTCPGCGVIHVTPPGDTRPTRYELTVWRRDHPPDPRMQPQPPLVMCARDDNGMVIGAVDGMSVQFGEDPQNVIVRGFRSHEEAVAWLKVKVREYAGRDDIDFKTTDGESQILIPRGPIPNLGRKM